jgi:hypothetical protein
VVPSFSPTAPGSVQQCHAEHAGCAEGAGPAQVMNEAEIASPMDGIEQQLESAALKNREMLARIAAKRPRQQWGHQQVLQEQHGVPSEPSSSAAHHLAVPGSTTQRWAVAEQWHPCPIGCLPVAWSTRGRPSIMITEERLDGKQEGATLRTDTCTARRTEGHLESTLEGAGNLICSSLAAQASEHGNLRMIEHMPVSADAVPLASAVQESNAHIPMHGVPLALAIKQSETGLNKPQIQSHPQDADEDLLAVSKIVGVQVGTTMYASEQLSSLRGSFNMLI